MADSLNIAAMECFAAEMEITLPSGVLVDQVKMRTGCAIERKVSGEVEVCVSKGTESSL